MTRIAPIAKQAAALPGLADVCMDTGLDQLPNGAADLTAKELRFVVCLMQHGIQRRAAIDAGYSETSADQIASELLGKPRVAAFYRRCLETLGSQAKSALARIEQRTRIFHTKAIEAAQMKGDLDELITLGKKQTSFKGDAGDHLSEEITQREYYARAEERYAKLALEGDKVLLTAAGKMGLELKVSGGLEHSVNLVSRELLPALTQLREETLHARN